MLLFDTRALLVSAFNQRRGTNHTQEEIEFGIPFSISELPAGTANIDNTCIRLKAGGYEETFTYRRLGLLEPMQSFSPSTAPLSLRMGDGTVAGGVAESFNKHYGYPMYPEDVLEDTTRITGNVLTLMISNRSVQWLPGQYTFTLDGEYCLFGRKIARLFTTMRVESEWWYENRVDNIKTPDNYPRADLLTYGNDYTPIANLLLRLRGNTDTNSYYQRDRERNTVLAEALRTVDGLPWSGLEANAVLGGPLNLAYLWCAYNGPTAGVDTSLLNRRNVPSHQLKHHKPINTEYDRVAILRPNSWSAPWTNFGFSPNSLILHYNIKD